MTPQDRTPSLAPLPQRPRRVAVPSRRRAGRTRTFAAPVVRELPPRRERRTSDW